MVTTIYFNGEKMFTLLHDTSKGLNKWFGDGQWFLGQDQVVTNPYEFEFSRQNLVVGYFGREF